MNKPDDIPQDVWDVAIEAAGPEHCFADVVERIGHAILAERERCARVAEREWRGVPLYPDGADIAKDIRSGEQP